MKNLLQVIEYEEITVEKINEIVKNEHKAKKIFEELEDFAKDNNELLQFSKRGHLKPQQYVGVIETKSGFVLEILPKIAKEDNKEKSKEILILMLKSLNNNFKKLNFSNLEKRKNFPLLEVFIEMFLDEVERLIVKGLKRAYLGNQENTKFLKGKLLINKQIEKNFIHKERFYIEYDEYSLNRIENKILKTTLIKLQKITKIHLLKIKNLLSFFENVGILHSNFKEYFKRIHLDRSMSYYEGAITLAKMFLLNETFMPYNGDSVAFALLFDMNKLFESFIGSYLKKNYSNVKLQHKKYNLFDNSNKFSLIPDIVFKDQIIIDTKWKIVNSQKDISQSDLYQMFAYASKYKDIKKFVLLYPYYEDIKIAPLKSKICNEEKEFHFCFVNLESLLPSCPKNFFINFINFSITN